MKKAAKLGFIILTFFILHCSLSAQPGKIALQHNGVTALYTDLNVAITASMNGDTIYLPGGTIFPVNQSITINKTLTIIGAGHFPDSTTATYRTMINGDIYILTGADGGSLCGVRFNGAIWFGNSVANQTVNNYRFIRCSLYNVIPGSTGGQNLSQNILFSECILLCNGSAWFTSALFEKSIFTNFDRYGGSTGSAVFNNCIFYTPNATLDANNSGSANIYNNCIIIPMYSPTRVDIATNGTIINNLLVSYINTNPTVYYNGNATVNNLLKESIINSFINAPTAAFSYWNNYHLKQTSLGHNIGTDGTDLGIYGTLTPFKEGSVPYNPHISSKSIGTTTNPTGTLNVNIKVSAQDR
jgi:hypothetical protein